MPDKIDVRLTVFLAAVSVLAFVSIVNSHCQIPCGIYDDSARFDMIAEDITTIEKSIKMITQLSKEDKPDMNQLVRWEKNKEKHAEHLSHIVTYYFMAQRIKVADSSNTESYQRYIKRVTLLHKMLIYSMKSKQGTDLANVEKLKVLLAEFRIAYFAAAVPKQP